MNNPGQVIISMVSIFPELRGFLLSPHQVSLGERPFGDGRIELDGFDHHLGFGVFPQLVLHGHPCRIVPVLEGLDVSYGHDFQQFAAFRGELDFVSDKSFLVYPDFYEKISFIFNFGLKLQNITLSASKDFFS